MFGPCFGTQHFVSVQLCNHLHWDERAGCFAIAVFLMVCDSQCFVALPHCTARCLWCVLPDHTHLLFLSKYAEIYMYRLSKTVIFRKKLKLLNI